jgi:hypothetical protein
MNTQLENFAFVAENMFSKSPCESSFLRILPPIP